MSGDRDGCRSSAKPESESNQEGYGPGTTERCLVESCKSTRRGACQIYNVSMGRSSALTNLRMRNGARWGFSRTGAPWLYDIDGGFVVLKRFRIKVDDHIVGSKETRGALRVS